MQYCKEAHRLGNLKIGASSSSRNQEKIIYTLFKSNIIGTGSTSQKPEARRARYRSQRKGAEMKSEVN